MKCPQCGNVQHQRDECRRCGFLFSRFHSLPSSQPVPGHGGARPSTPLGGKIVLGFGALCLILVVLGALRGARHRSSGEALTVFPATGEVEWLTDAAGYEQGQRARVRQNLPLVVYFYADWCSSCKTFKKKVLPDARVQHCLSQAINVQVKTDAGAKESQITEGYGVQYIPAVFVLLPGSIQPKRLEVSYDPAEFAERCEALL